MAENITKPTNQNVDSFLNGVEHKRRKEDALTLLPLMTKWTDMKPVIWSGGLAGKTGSGIIGFGHYHYHGAGGREGDWFLTGFSPRKANMAIYIMPGFKNLEKELVQLGPHKHSVSCLYLTNLQKNDLGALEKIVEQGFAQMKKSYDWKPS